MIVGALRGVVLEFALYYVTLFLVVVVSVLFSWSLRCIYIQFYIRSTIITIQLWSLDKFDD